MNRQQFRDSLKALGMTRGQFAKHVGLHPASVYHWGGQDHPVPHWAVMLVAAWEANKRQEAELRMTLHREARLLAELEPLRQFAA